MFRSFTSSRLAEYTHLLRMQPPPSPSHSARRIGSGSCLRGFNSVGPGWMRLVHEFYNFFAFTFISCHTFLFTVLWAFFFNFPLTLTVTCCVQYFNNENFLRFVANVWTATRIWVTKLSLAVMKETDSVVKVLLLDEWYKSTLIIRYWRYISSM